MKTRIYLLIILLGWSIQNKAQSDYLTPTEGYEVKDLVTDYTFSSFEVNDGTLYGFDIDGIHAFNAASGELLFTEAKPNDYSAQPSFMKMDLDNEYLWMGFTKSDYSDDRIYRFHLVQKTWEHMATLPANFDLEFIGDNMLVSGLNSGTWGDPNNIWLLDLSGSNSHTKIVETGGSSAGLASDAAGNVYYASYFMIEDNRVYKWDAADIMAVISGSADALTISDATVLADLPAGAYDCDVDDSDNLVFNCNDFTNGGFVAIWDGNTGSGANYTSSCTTTQWLTFVKATGNVNTGDEFYTLAYAQAVAEIKAEAEPVLELVNPIADLRKQKNITDFQIDLNSVFEYGGGDLTFEISTNSNSSLINATISESQLNLSAINDQIGSSNIEITASADGQSLSDEFEISIFDYNYEDGVFIVNNDWTGNDEGSVNFYTNEGDFVYRAFRHENPGETLGTTSQFATFYGDHIFFMSKEGNRLVIANRQSLEKEETLTGIGGEGRAFIGVDAAKAYIGTSNGIRTINLNNLSLGNFISGVSVKTGGMLKAENYVFVIGENQVHVLENDEIIETYSGSSFAGITRSVDGNVWVGAGNQLLKISPYTLESEILNLPNEMNILGTEGNAASLCASNIENALYWSKAEESGNSKLIYKYEIGNISSLNESFYTLPNDWIISGAGLRIHPEEDNVFITARKEGSEDNSKFNKLFIVNAENGELENSTELDEYFWYPAMPMMVDKHAPQLSEEIIVEVDMNSAMVQIDLFDHVSDIDNLEAGIEFEILGMNTADIISAQINDHILEISFLSDAFGDVIIELQAISNGKILDFEANVQVNSTVGNAFINESVISCSPNPFNTSLQIAIPENEEFQVMIYNLNGQLVYEQQIIGTSYLHLDALVEGSYLLKLISEKETYTKKIIKN